MTAMLSPTAYAVLGLVSVRPTTGHDLAAYAERSIGQFFPLTRSHVYSELDRLCRLGLLEVTEVPQQRFPTKRVYDITPHGVEQFDDWLADSALPPERHRNLFLVHVFFGDHMSPERMAALLDAYEAASVGYRDLLIKLVDRLADRPESRFRRATAMFGLAQVQAKLDWLDKVRPILLAEPCPESAPC
jgi:DNA-binding PadR family transcriptional regulator